jgi:hypothetical protein
MDTISGARAAADTITARVRDPTGLRPARDSRQDRGMRLGEKPAAMNPLRKTWWRYDEKEGGPRMTTREALHQLVDQLPENQAELAHVWLLDLRDAADEDGPPFGQEALASLDRGLADLAAGRVKPLAEYERERGL